MPLASFLLRESFVPRRSPPCVPLTPFRNIVRARRLSRRRLSSRRLSSGCLSSRLLSSGCLSFSFGCCQHRRGRSDAECYTCSQDSQHPPAREHFHCSYLAHFQLSLNCANTSKSLGWRMPVRKEEYVVPKDSGATTRRRPYFSGLEVCAVRRDGKRMRPSRMMTQNFSHPAHDRDQLSPHADRDPASDGVQWLEPELSKALATRLIGVPALGRWCLSL
jgi:hypothetical protein